MTVNKKTMRLFRSLVLVLLLLSGFTAGAQSAQNNGFPQGTTRGTTEMGTRITGIDFPNITLNATSPRTGKEVAFSVQLLLLLTLLTLAPSIFILMTCFLRFSIVLDFIKRALSLQQVPPTAVLNGIALFMTMFCMWPTFTEVYENSFRPLSNNEITIDEAYKGAEASMRKFMFIQMDGKTTAQKNLSRRIIGTFLKMSGRSDIRNIRPDEIPTYVLIPSYILHELTVAFKIGILLYIPFIVIDMVVASILMSMGMMMLPPVQISMPFKLMLFVLVDGWSLLTQKLFESVLH